MKRKHHGRASRQAGVILLVVLGALTFFSVLVAAYLVFSNESRDASFAISQRSTRAPDVDWVMNEALMTLIRGTSDPNNPFFGEDLLSDYYGRFDAVDMRVKPVNLSTLGPVLVADRFVRFPVGIEGTPVQRDPNEPLLDDVYTGRLITFTQGPLQNRTFRVLRSDFRPTQGGNTEWDDLYIELDADVFGTTTPTATDVLSLFYPNIMNLNLPPGGYLFHMNGAVRNSRGVGYNNTTRDIDVTTGNVATLQQPKNPFLPRAPATGNVGWGFDLPLAIQPNHIGRNVDKSTTRGDFDEGYDAADFNNWFLSHRRPDGSMIPSFHRPSVLNYIVNETDWSSAAPADYQRLIASLARATFRPLPIATGQLYTDPALVPVSSAPINERFTGGSNEFALRTALSFTGNPVQLDQLLQALIAGEWDVDNDSDGIPDSIWVDLGLPTFTSREGKLLRPLVAPMIEDLGGRLNVNAHGNQQLRPEVAGLLRSDAFWAGVRDPLGAATNERFVFRGLGWGPAEIMLPATSANNGILTNATIQTNLLALLNDRYQYGDQPLQTPDFPGITGRDPLDRLRFGNRPPQHTAVSKYGYSTDPFGRGGMAMGRSGHVLAAGSGTVISAAPMLIDEATENPYEMDPSGFLHGDSAFTVAEFEAILRSNDFDSELLPEGLRQRLQSLIQAQPEFTRVFTTISKSDDTAPSIAAGSTPLLSWIQLVLAISGSANSNVYSQAQWNRLTPPEFRLGRKLDVNRAIGNGVDDNNNGVIDEPLEVTRVDADGTNNDSDTMLDELGEVPEQFAFAHYGANGTLDITTIPGTFRQINSATPNYTFDELPVANGDPTISGRQLLARHLYLLMMALSRDLDAAGNQKVLPTISAGPAAPARPAGAAPFNEDFYKARRIAQWAVNVVDYRDPDSIMTRFVFDPNPFDVDPDPATPSIPGLPANESGWSPPVDTLANPATAEFVVWGVEEPQLVFSESMAFHDVRLRDTNRDGNQNATKTDPTPDDHSDQVRIPEGSLFLELYCPHPVVNGDQQTKPSAPQELFVTNPATGFSQLDLARRAPAAPGSGTLGAPVWRVAISEAHYAGIPSAKDALAPAVLRDSLPETASFDPQFADELGAMDAIAGGPLLYDRFVLFTDFPFQNTVDVDPNGVFNNAMTPQLAATDMQPGQVFYAPTFNGDAVTNADRLLEPGQFLVLAPRIETRLGSKEFAGNYPGLPSDQRLTIFPNEGLIQADHNDMRRTPALAAAGTAATPALPLLIAAPMPDNAWVGGNHLQRNVVGLNVSEPLPRNGSYYPQPTNRFNGTVDADGDGTEDYPFTDGYIDFSDPATNARDEPLDVIVGRIPNDGMEPILGSVPSYCSAFLQRLADPTVPFHPVYNPYRTVDWINIDLNVFSGEDRPANISPTPALYSRRSRQRIGAVRDVAGNSVQANALYSYETNAVEMSTPNAAIDATAPDFYQFALAGAGAGETPYIQSSFSFLNTQTTGINPNFTGFSPSLGSLGAAASNIVGNDRNLPQVPYAMHPWLNRPFASHLELMMVPACSQGRLFQEFSFDVAADPAIYPTSGVPSSPPDPAEVEVFNAPFRHLLNFFHSGDEGDKGLEFVRLFDLVHTLPRYRGEVDLISPERWTNPLPPLPTPPAVDPPSIRSERVLRQLWDPPFGMIYDNQRQGTVNLNTIAEFPVWAGLMQGHLNPVEFSSPQGTPGTADQLSFNRLLESRRGYAVPLTPPAPSRVTGTPPYNYVPASFDPRFPTEFAGVFRSSIETRSAMELRAPDDTLLQRRPVHGTMLRGAGPLEIIDPPAGVSTTTPLFVRASTQAPQPPISPADPNVPPLPNNDAPHDRFRNSFMRYQTLTRMPNLVSDNSQVFLIRMTVGFFEVDALTQSLQGEYNAESGRNKRYKATFVVDRSIPVGHVPGQDLNARDCVIFESYDP